MVLHKRGSAWSGASYSAETLAYQTRVEADGGTVHSLDAVEAAYQLIAAQSLSPAVWVSAAFGYKLSVGYLAKLYDLSANNNDMIGTVGSLPAWEEDQQNGLPCVVAGNTHMSFSTLSLKSGFFAVKKAAVENKCIFLSYDSSADYYLGCGRAASGDSADFGNLMGAVEAEATTGSPQAFHVVSWKYDGSNDLYIARDGSYGSGVAQGAVTPSFNLLLSYSNSAYTFEGLFGEGILFSDLLSSGQFTAIEGYLADVWGLP